MEKALLEESEQVFDTIFELKIQSTRHSIDCWNEILLNTEIILLKIHRWFEFWKVQLDNFDASQGSSDYGENTYKLSLDIQRYWK